MLRKRSSDQSCTEILIQCSVTQSDSDGDILVFLADTFEALQQLADLVLMNRLQLPVTDAITEHNDAVWQRAVDTVVVLQST